MTMLTIIGSFVIGFFLASYFVGLTKPGDDDFVVFCRNMVSWLNKKKK